MAYLSRQIGWAVFSVWAVATLCFIAVHRLPGDPARLILGPQASASAMANFRRDAGLNKPVAVQYATFLRRLLGMDFGKSHALRRPVADLLRERGIVSTIVAASALAVAIAVGFGVPLICRRLRWWRVLGLVRTLSSATAFVPPHILSLITLVLFAGILGWMPVIFEPKSMMAWIAPALVLAAYPAALVLQLFDARLVEETAASYCTRARASGFTEHHIIWREAARNAAPAALAALTNGLAFFVTGALFVEVTFGLPGIGRLTQDAIRTEDVSVLAGICVTVSAFVVMLALALRITQAALNPRLRF